MARPAPFLKPLRQVAHPPLRLEDTRNGAVLAGRVLAAFDSAARRTGLLKYDAMPEDAALVIAPSNGIHTFFMRFAIDVVFVDRLGKVMALRHHLGPWRVAVAWRAYAVIEMAAGTLQRTGVQRGDFLDLRPA